MNILKNWRSRWTNKQLALMQEEHDKELQYMAVQHNRRVEVLTRERDAANQRITSLMTGMRSLLKSQGSSND
jgi:predicted  nucleic acid-binding Zn-ribbon protein